MRNIQVSRRQQVWKETKLTPITSMYWRYCWLRLRQLKKRWRWGCILLYISNFQFIYFIIVKYIKIYISLQIFKTDDAHHFLIVVRHIITHDIFNQWPNKTERERFIFKGVNNLRSNAFVVCPTELTMKEANYWTPDSTQHNLQNDMFNCKNFAW